MYGKYSFSNFIKAYYENKEIIESCIKGETYEGLDGETKLVLGLDVGVFMAIMLLYVALWIWALIATIVFWNQISVVAQIFAIIGLLFPSIGPVITLLAVYISRAIEKKKGGKRSRK